MSWADKAKSGGGASVEGTIVGFEFSTYFPLGDNTEPGDSAYLTLEIEPAGADENIKKPFYVGSSKFITPGTVDKKGAFVAGDDGPVLFACERDEDGAAEVDEEGSPKLYDRGEAFALVSAIDAQLADLQTPMEDLVEDPSETHKIDFTPLIGMRVRIEEIIDRDRQIEAGRKALDKVKKGSGKAATEDEAFIAGKREVKKGEHKGKRFNLTKPQLTKILGLPGEDADAAKKGAKAGAKATKGGKKAAPAADEDEDTDDADEDTDEAAEEEADDDADVAVKPKVADGYLTDILTAAKGHKAKKSELVTATVRYLAKNKLVEQRPAVLKMFADDDYLAGAAKRKVIEAFKAGKDPVLVLAE